MTKPIPHWYKPSPLGPIPKDWMIEEMEEISLIETGSKDTQNKVENWLYPFFVRSDNVERINTYSKDCEAILTSWDGVWVWKNFHYINSKFDFHQRVYCISNFSNDVFWKFIFYYFFQHFYGRAYRLSAKNSVDSVRMEMIAKMKIPLPPLPEQKAITSILSDCDESITQTQQLIEKLELRHKALCQQLLTGKKRVTGFDDERKEQQIGKYITHTPREVPKPSDAYLSLWVRSHGKWMFQKPDTDPKANAMKSLYEVKENDLVLSITFAREHAVAIVRNIDEWGLVSHRFPTYTFKERRATHRFFKYFIKQSRFKYQLWVISPWGAWRNRVLSKKDFVKLLIKVPSFEEQIAIADILETSEQEIKKARQKLHKLETSKKWLMQQLLTGKTRVPESYLTE